jgi:hypothetical protein
VQFPPYSSGFSPASGKISPVVYPGQQVASIVGLTKNSGGAALGNCIIKLFWTATDLLYQQTISDGSGNYSFQVQPSTSFYAVAYLAGSPDVTGATLNTITGV